MQFIREILSLGVERKEWVSEIEADVDLIAYSIVSALRGIMVDLVVEERFPHWDERIGVLSEVFLRGLKR